MKLHPYQIAGAQWLSKRSHAILGDKMGLGKTAQAITAADLVGASKILIVCRAVARRNWRHEFRIFSTRNRRVLVVEADTQKLGSAENTVVICSYEGIDRTVAMLGDDCSFDLVVVDESHFVKSVKAKRSMLVFGPHGLIRKAKRLWCLTGTPTPNNASELWLPLFVFGATKLTLDKFIDEFCYTRDYGYGKQVSGSKTDPATVSKFQTLCAKVMLSRDLSDSKLNLPPVSFEDVVVEGGKVDFAAHADFAKFEPADLMERIEDEYFILESILNGRHMSDELLDMVKASASSITTLRRYVGLQKIEPTVTLLKGELESDSKLKIVIFAQHRSCISGLAQGLNEYNPVVVQGGSDPKATDEGIRDFQNRAGRARVFIGQTQAAGTSITLTAANEVVTVEKSWAPSDNAQAIARCVRIGQTRPVRVRNILLDDPIDVRMSDLIQKKTEEIFKLYSKENQS